MPRTTEANQQIRDERRDQILTVAKELFLAKGLSSLKIGDLAKALDMSQGLLYRYFTNKEAVFATIVEQATSSMMSQFMALTETATPGQRLHQLIELLLADIRRNPGRHQIILQALAQPGKAHQKVQEMTSYLKEHLLQLITEAQATGEATSGNPNSLAVLLLSCLQGLASSIDYFIDSDDASFPCADLLWRIFQPGHQP